MSVGKLKSLLISLGGTPDIGKPGGRPMDDEKDEAHDDHNDREENDDREESNDSDDLDDYDDIDDRDDRNNGEDQKDPEDRGDYEERETLYDTVGGLDHPGHGNAPSVRPEENDREDHEDREDREEHGNPARSGKQILSASRESCDEDNENSEP